MQTNKTHWQSLLILLVLGAGAALLLLAALIFGGMAVFDLIQDSPAAATEMINAAVFAFESLLMLACGWFVLQKTLGRVSAEQPIQLPFSGLLIPAVFAVVIPSLAVGVFTSNAEMPLLSLLTLPLLTILVIGLPVFLLAAMGCRGINLGARWRLFSILGLGITLSPFVMLSLEFILLAAFILAWAIFVSAQPDLLAEMLRLAEVIGNEQNQEIIVELLAPYIFQPGVVAAMLLYVSALVPFIEELLKPLAVWLFAKSLDTPAQGFALGALSGAAFGLVESLNAGADGSSAWGVLVSVRAMTTLLHITASGLVGWGIALLFQQRRVLRFLAAYLLAVFIHGLWNACALLTGLSSISVVVESPAWLSNIIPAALGGMVTLALGMFILLLASNRTLRSQSIP